MPGVVYDKQSANGACMHVCICLFTGSKAMPYTHFRYIAYEVPTATSIPPDGPVVSGFDAGPECPAVARIPVADTTPDDARKRLKRLAAVVDHAVTWVQNNGGDNANTLKVFITPEFYFRPPRALGPGYEHDTYPMEDFNKIFEQLDLMFMHPDLQNWLIVPGTVLWNLNDSFAGHLFLNTAFYVLGNQANSLGYIEKKLPSTIDGIPWPYAPGNDAFLKPIYEQWNHRKQHVFPIGDVFCGLEVCLDHADSKNCRVLKTVLSDWDKNQGGNQEVALHLLTAGGMTIKENSVAAKDNGYILRNDGFSNSPHSELRQIQRYVVIDPLLKQVLKETTSSDPFGTAELALSVTVGVHNIPLPNDATRVRMKGNPYSEFTQRLVIYPPQPLL
jgi:hypothetical protein